MSFPVILAGPSLLHAHAGERQEGASRAFLAPGVKLGGASVEIVCGGEGSRMSRKVEETLLPPVSGWEEREDARPEEDAAVAGAFADRTRVRIRLVATKLPRSDRLGEVGCGVLIDRLAIGGPLRIAIDGAPAFVTSPVRGLQRLGQHTVQIVTANSVYSLERESSPRAAEAVLTDLDARDATSESDAALNDDSTSFVPLSQLAPLGSGPFAEGARMRISRLKTHDPGSERLGELGVGRVLDRLEVGQTVRLSVEGGPTFATSPVRAIHRIGEHMVEIETANSTYRIQKLEE
jgi:hypothetical protein